MAQWKQPKRQQKNNKTTWNKAERHNNVAKRIKSLLLRNNSEAEADQGSEAKNCSECVFMDDPLVAVGVNALLCASFVCSFKMRRGDPQRGGYSGYYKNCSKVELMVIYRECM